MLRYLEGVRGLALLLLGLVAGCPQTLGTPAGGPPQEAGVPAYEPCSSYCVRPADGGVCDVAYTDSGTCPTGFRCSLTSPCDGGLR